MDGAVENQVQRVSLCAPGSVETLKLPRPHSLQTASSHTRQNVTTDSASPLAGKNSFTQFHSFQSLTSI